MSGRLQHDQTRAKRVKKFLVGDDDANFGRVPGAIGFAANQDRARI